MGRETEGGARSLELDLLSRVLLCRALCCRCSLSPFSLVLFLGALCKTENKNKMKMERGTENEGREKNGKNVGRRRRRRSRRLSALRAPRCVHPFCIDAGYRALALTPFVSCYFTKPEGARELENGIDNPTSNSLSLSTFIFSSQPRPPSSLPSTTGLALGGLGCLSSLRWHGFTHVLSVINLPVSIPERDDDDDEEEEKRGGEGETTTAAATATATTAAAAARSSSSSAAASTIRHARIDLIDDERADLLSHLPFATAWVREALTTPSGGEEKEREGEETEEAEGGEEREEERQRAPKGNKVLIHCSAGVSRSAAVAAACLMALKSTSSSSPAPLSAVAAVAAVAAAAPGTAPNAGFLKQLALFQEMGCRLDAKSSAEYRVWRARAMANAAAGGSEASGSGGGGGGGGRAATGTEAATAAKDRPPPPLTTYRCRTCRRLVATSDNAVPATSETGGGPQKMFAGKSWNKAKLRNTRGGAAKKKAAGGVDDEEKEEEEEEEEEEREEEAPPLPLGSDGSSLFVEPLKWMLDALSLESSGGGGRGKKQGSGGGDDGDKEGEEASKETPSPPPTKGKLHCPGCSSRLGSFSWAGSQSAQGGWVVPAFQLHLCRLDAAEEEEEEGKREQKERREKGDASSPALPAVPPSVASRIRQPRFLK